MPARKRGRAEMESIEPPEPPQDEAMLARLRNTWEFANLMQYIFIFGRAVKIDEDFDIEDLETECLKPQPSEKLSEIGLALLKCVSSHRGLTPDIFDEYTRRQYLAKAPARNPFGVDEEPKKFAEFDVFTKLRVLVQLSQWTLINAERMRERMPEVKDTEQIQWRIEEIGYDKQERLYFVLDDNRLYRRTDPPAPAPPAPKPKSNSKKGRAAARASKRRKVVETEESANDADGEAAADEAAEGRADDGFGGRTWECVAVTLTEYREFLDTIRKSRDPDEKALLNRISEDVLPVIEKAEEAQLRKQARKEREQSTMQKLATAKRSSRLASKQEKEKEEQEAAEAERKRKADLAAAKADQEKQIKMGEARESRMKTREQRLKEREYKRILQEEELASLSEDNKKLDAGEARMSERHLKAEMEKRKKELAALAEEDEWTFDCSVCGVHGENLDDGSHSIACEKCNVWQHSACHGISQAAAEKDDFHFICIDCKRRAEDALKPKIPSLKFRIGSSTSPPSQKTTNRKHLSNENGHLPQMKKFKHVEINSAHASHRPSPVGAGPTRLTQNGMHDRIMNGPTLSPQGQTPYSERPLQNGISTASPPPGFRRQPGPPTVSNGYTHRGSPQHGYDPRTYTQPSAAILNGNVNIHGISQNPAWSATYQSPRPANTPQQAQPVPPSANPFHNSFNRQHQHPSLSPLANSPALSPPQHTFSPANGTNPSLPNTNGLPSQTYSLPPPLPPPVKHQSASPKNTANHIPSSSPIAGPNLHREAPPSPGFSPTKQTSPRPTPIGNAIAHSSLSPTLQRQAPQSPGLSPVKHSSPRPTPLSKSLNDPSSSPVAGPALLNKAAPSPGLSPTKQSPPRKLPSLSNGIIPPLEAFTPSPPRQPNDISS